MNLAKLPIVRGVLRKLQIMNSALRLYIPPGHYYSPIVSTKEVFHDQKRIFDKNNNLAGIDLNIAIQAMYLEAFKQYYLEFANDYIEASVDLIYTPNNGFYSYADGIFLFSFMRHLKPSTIIEIGSGYSSSLMYDVDNKYLENKTKLVFIEPYPEERFYKIFSKSKGNYEIVKSKVQNVDLGKFLDLGFNDILFIDSSHVSKTGSDLNFLLFDVLPKLKKGVIVHFHDIFYPFEYPLNHVLGNRWFSWNEAYLLRSFLIFNSQFEIIFWNSFLEHSKSDFLQRDFPLYFKGGSASLWIRKL